MLLSACFAAAYSLYLWKVARVGRQLASGYTRIFVKVVPRIAFFSLVVIAIMGPSFGDSRREIKSVGKDIIICVDLSKSMDAFDVQPSRLEKVKYEMKRIVQAFNSDRIGIIIFSSEAFVQCPLTYDQNALNLFIETMNTGLVPSSGTDFAPPLRMALNKFNNPEGPSTRQKSKVVVLISDGEDFGDDTDAVARDVQDENIKLFTLGVGTTKGSPIPAGKSYKTDRSGTTAVSRLNSESLRRLANKTDGKYFEINESRNDVARLINTINKIEGELRDTRYVDVSANRYFYFLLAALLLLVADVLLNVKTIRI